LIHSESSPVRVIPRPGETMNEALPVEIIEHVFRFLPDQGVVFVCYDVCRWWRSIVHSMPGLSIVRRNLEKRRGEAEHWTQLTDDDLWRVKNPVAIVHTLPYTRLTVFPMSITTIKFMPAKVAHLVGWSPRHILEAESNLSAIYHLSGLTCLEIDLDRCEIDKIIESFPKLRQVCLGFCPEMPRDAIHRLVQHLGKQRPLPVKAPPSAPLSVKWVTSEDKWVTSEEPDRKRQHPICPLKHVNKPITRLRVTGTAKSDDAHVAVGPSTYHVRGTFSIDPDTVGGHVAHKGDMVYGCTVMAHGCTGLTVSSDHIDGPFSEDALVVVCDSAHYEGSGSVMDVVQYMVNPLKQIDVYDTPSAGFHTLGMFFASTARSDGVVRIDTKFYNVRRMQDRDMSLHLHLPTESPVKVSFYTCNVTTENGSLAY